MALVDVSGWMDEYTLPNVVWYVKRLSGNDTLANGTHQGGPYVPKSVIFSVFPELHDRLAENPDKWFPFYLDSDPDVRDVRAVWYNNKLRGGTRSEARITGFGGKSSPLLDPESTGAIAIFAFVMDGPTATKCHAWVSHDELEEDLIEARTGPIEPRTWTTLSAGNLPTLAPDDRPSLRASCQLSREEIPHEWLSSFPTESQIIEKAISMKSAHGMTPDQRILARRKCEQEIFRSVEEAVELPRLKAGFTDLDTFLERAQTILQRRRTRSGASLSLHTRHILLEEGFQEGSDFDQAHDPASAANPDFVFPSASAYRDRSFPEAKLRMLSVMVTCRDRWRHILRQAERVRTRHLLTLQEGVSENQFKEMQDANVTLVVPEALRESYPPSVRPHLLSIESFMADLRLLS